MDKLWIENDVGYFFSKELIKNKFIWNKLNILCLNELVKKDDSGIVIPYEVSIFLSEEDCELFTLPPLNPYRISVRANGDLGHNNLEYILEVIQPNGEPFINPVFKGTLLYLSSTRIYRLNADQYQLVCLTMDSNKRIFSLNRREILGFNLLNLYKIQRHAKLTEAKLDDILSEDNTKIVVPDRLNIEFKETNDEKIKIEPILLEKDFKGNYKKLNSSSFQDIFNKRRNICDIYIGKDRTKYICSEKIKNGLLQIKNVADMSKEEGNRYRKQPKELFSDDIFLFDYENQDSKNLRQSWLPEENNLEDMNYSDRVIGIKELKFSSYYGINGYKTNWLDTKDSFEETHDNCDDSINDKKEYLLNINNNKEELHNVANTPVSNLDGNLKDMYIQDGININSSSSPNLKSKTVSLDIKANFEHVDYKKDKNGRQIYFRNETVLKKGIDLLDYQIIGVNWIFEQWAQGYHGVLLADDMGLGKTLQVLTFIAYLKKIEKEKFLNTRKLTLNKPILIVAPISLLQNWENEYNKFIVENIFSTIIQLHGQSLKKYAVGDKTPNGKRKLKFDFPNDCIVMTSYETLRDYQFSFAEISWSVIIADEAQKIKSPKIGVTLALKAMKYDYAICLSGTPVENSWIDLWTIMDFIQPAHLKDLKTFRSMYIDKLSEKENTKDNILLLGEKLKRQLEPLFLRRMKSDKLKGLPKKYVYRCLKEMPDYQKQCYISIIEEAKMNKIHPLITIAKLRDISLHPDLNSKTMKYFFEMNVDEIIKKSARLIVTFEILKDIQNRNEKVLIFLTSKKMQLILQYLVQEKFNLKVLTPINSDINVYARQKIIDSFNKSINFNVLILSPEVAGVGFTITSANNVIHLSRTWNPAKEDQATDRVYRIGQKKDVNVYLPMAIHKELGKDGSFDEKLDGLLTYKRTLSKYVLYPTNDSSKDGFYLFDKLNLIKSKNIKAYYWNINDIDDVTGDIFEEIITALYNNMEEYKAYKTPHSNDNGADVVVSLKHKNKGILIQCKHKENMQNAVSGEGVQEIYAAIKYYQKINNGREFMPVVITNAIRFTKNAICLAKTNNVKLIARQELQDMLNKYPVLKVN